MSELGKYRISRLTIQADNRQVNRNNSSNTNWVRKIKYFIVKEEIFIEKEKQQLWEWKTNKILWQGVQIPVIFLTPELSRQLKPQITDDQFTNCYTNNTTRPPPPYLYISKLQCKIYVMVRVVGTLVTLSNQYPDRLRGHCDGAILSDQIIQIEISQSVVFRTIITPL